MFIFYVLLFLLAAPLLTVAVYAGYNLAIAPWLQWPEMPVPAAVLLGSVLAVKVTRAWFAHYTIRSR